MTATDWQDQILLEVGAGLDGSDLGGIIANISTYWDLYADKQYYTRLQYLYVKRHCVRVLMGQLRLKINKSLGPLSKSLGDYFAHLSELYKTDNEEIVRIEKQGVAAQEPVVGRIKGVPTGNCCQDEILFRSNPNDPKYRGGDPSLWPHDNDPRP